MSTTPKVEYAYADGASNTIRPTGLTYPNGRAVTYSYGTAGTLGDLSSRVTELNEGASTRVEYGYLGLSGVVTTRYPDPGVTYTLVGTAGGVDSDTGDIYHGLDRFGRVKDAYWHKASGSVDVARIQYGYDRASNRTWRYDAVAREQSKSFDELYQYDGLQRLKALDRGKLDAPRTGLDSGSGSFGECWTLDETGNWKGYRRDDNGDGSWDIVQSRTSNAVNEIVATTGTPTPAYDAAGNMTSLGSGGGTGWAELTLGDWSDLELSEWAAMPLTSGGATGLTATYDAWNRLVKLSRGAETVRTYHYDGRKYRIAVGSYTEGSLASTRHLYYSTGWQVLEERVVLAAAASGAETTTPPERQFVWGTRYIDDLVLRDRDVDGNSTLEERKYALQDANWNVIALTDDSGAVDERYAYSAYGAAAFLNPSFTPVGTGTSAFDWETLYAAYRHEPATGLFHVRNRAYAPGLGVWLQRDPARSTPNLYGYSGRPLGSVDPQGLLEVKITDQLRRDIEESVRQRIEKMVNSGEISRLEGFMRRRLISNALRSPIAYSEGDGNRSDLFCETEDGYVVKPGVNPSKAFLELWKMGNGTVQMGCSKACDNIFLKSAIDTQIYRRKFDRTPDPVRTFDSKIGNTLPPTRKEIMEQIQEGVYGPIKESDFKAGDQAWMKNPAYSALPEGWRSDNYPGEGGMNVIAVGDGRYISYTGDTLYDRVGLQDTIKEWPSFKDYPENMRAMNPTSPVKFQVLNQNVIQFGFRGVPKVP